MKCNYIRSKTLYLDRSDKLQVLASLYQSLTEETVEKFNEMKAKIDSKEGEIEFTCFDYNSDADSISSSSISSDSSSGSLCLNETITGTVVLEEHQEEDASHMDKLLAAEDGDNEKCNDNPDNDRHPQQ